MKILLVGAYGFFWHEPAWAEGLRGAGHEVLDFGTVRYMRKEPMLARLWDKAQNRHVFGPMLNRINRDLLAAAAEFKPDILLCYRALTVYPETVRKIRNSGVRAVCYHNDNIFGPLAHKSYWRHFRNAIPEYDAHFVFRASDIPHYLKHGAKRAEMIRSYYLPWVHRKLPAEEINGFHCDIGFFGHCEPDRRVQEMTTLMQRVPAKYHLRGAQWAENGEGRPWHGMELSQVQGEEYVKAINGASIALAFLSTYNEDTYTQRSFEIPACGAFMLSQRTDDLKTLYEEGKEADYFSSGEELADKAAYYLKNSDARRRIAEAGYVRATTSGYDIYSRMRELISRIG